MKIILLTIIFSLTVTMAYAQIAGTGGSNRAVGPTFGRGQYDFGMGLGGGPGGSSAPSTCSTNPGTYDFSSGCTLGMIP